MIGVIESSQQKHECYHCTMAPSGIFVGGAVFGLISVSLGIIYYILASEVRSTLWGPTPDRNIPMEQPSWKP